MPSRTLPDFTTGTVTVTNGSRTVTGAGTGWTTTANGVTESTIAAGDMLIVGTGRPVMIDSVDSATQVTLVENWPNATASGTAYKIRRYVALPTGSVLAALQSVEARGTDTTPLTSFTVDGGTTRVKVRQATGGQGAISVGATGTADASLLDAVLLTSTALVGIRGVPSKELDIIRAQNATTTTRVYNANTGASATAEFMAQTGTANATLSLAAYDNAAAPYAAIKAGSAATALFRDAAAHVWRSADGTTERMRLNSSGNVGVNTAAPSGRFHVLSSTDDPAIISQTDNAQTAPFQLQARGATDGNKQLLIGYNTTSNYGAVQAIWQGTSYSALALNPLGGNVGIGTSAPGYKLDVSGAGAPDLFMRTQGASGAGAIWGVSSGGAAIAGTVTSHPLILFANNAERMRIDSAGNVGLGTTAPSYKFDIYTSADNDGIQVTKSAGSSIGIRANSTAGAANPMVQTGDVAMIYSGSGGVDTGAITIGSWSTTAKGIRINSAGNVGVNISSIAATLHVAGSARFGALNTQTRPASDVGGGMHVTWNYSSGSGETDIWNLYDNSVVSFSFKQKTGADTHSDLYNFGNSNHIWYTTGSERMRIDTSGKVGIGISSPASALDVNGVLTVRANITGPSTGFAYTVGANPDASVTTGGYIQFWGSTSPTPGAVMIGNNGTERIRVDNSGNVGIGLTNPVNKLDITGSLGRGAPVTKTASFTLAATENWIICNGTGSITVTLPAASSWTGREVMLKTIAAQTVVSASSNVVPLAGGAAGTAILAATAGKWATLVSDGTNWIIMQAA